MKPEFWTLSLINSIFVVIRKDQISYWPEIDNLNGLQEIWNSKNSDYYTKSLLHSPRVITIYILKLVSIITNSSAALTLSIAAIIVSLFGLPLLYIAVRSRLSEVHLLTGSRTSMIAFSIFCAFLYSDLPHKIEVNGFFINPFSLGATTANLSLLFFTVGILVDRKITKFTLLTIAFTIHLTTATFLAILFTSFNYKRIGYIVNRFKEFTLVILFSIATFFFFLNNNISTYSKGWDYYINERAANHYLISTSNRASFQCFIIIALVYLIFSRFIAQTSGTRVTSISLIITAFICTLFAYNYYAIPVFLAGILFLIYKELQKSIIMIISILLFLLALQCSESDKIRVVSSLFVPGTRFIPMVNFFFILLVIHKTTKILDQYRKPKTTISVTTIYYRQVLKIISVLTIALFLISNSSSQYKKLNSTVLENFPEEFSSGKEYLPVSMDTVGMREFRKMAIFVDEYPFWSNLNEYAIRMQLLKEVQGQISDGTVTIDNLRKLRVKYRVNRDVILLIPVRFKDNIASLECLRVSRYYTCEM